MNRKVKRVGEEGKEEREEKGSVKGKYVGKSLETRMYGDKNIKVNKRDLVFFFFSVRRLFVLSLGWLVQSCIEIGEQQLWKQKFGNFGTQVHVVSIFRIAIVLC